MKVAREKLSRTTAMVVFEKILAVRVNDRRALSPGFPGRRAGGSDSGLSYVRWSFSKMNQYRDTDVSRIGHFVSYYDLIILTECGI